MTWPQSSPWEESGTAQSQSTHAGGRRMAQPCEEKKILPLRGKRAWSGLYWAIQ